MNRFAKYSWIVLGWNMLVILWGTIVRATGSGAGCGNHWPTCNGILTVTPQKIQTAIEFTHRMMSGLALISIFILLVWGLRNYPKGNHQRVGFIGAAILIIVEALLGAGLVLFKLVGTNSSGLRAGAVSIHLLNTFILLAFIALNAWWASGGKPITFSNKNSLPVFFGIGLAGIALIGMSGSITALGDTLFPSTSLAQTFAEQSNPAAHFLIQLRIFHPIFAILIGTYLLFLINHHSQLFIDPIGKKLAQMVVILICIQWAAGVTNVFLLAPVWLQVVHLFIADCVWISFVLMSAYIFSIKGSEVL